MRYLIIYITKCSGILKIFHFVPLVPIYSIKSFDSGVNVSFILKVIKRVSRFK